MAPPDYAAFLCSLISEFRQLSKTHRRALETDAWQLQEEYRGAKASLARALNPNRENMLIAALEWWGRQEASIDSEVQRIRFLKLLLDCLDEYYSHRQAHRISERGLVLGQRWWNVAMRCDKSNDSAGLLDGCKRTTGYEFPHLRTVACSEAEWFPSKCAFDPVLAERVLRVGLCPLSGKARTFFSGTRVLPAEKQTAGFVATSIAWQGKPGVDDQSRADPSPAPLGGGYEEELRASIQWARNEGVHVLCFPELCVCERGRRFLIEEIEKDSGALCLVIPGSYHVLSGEGLHVNTAPIWLVHRGKVRALADYEKVDPMGLETSQVRKDQPEAAGLLAVLPFAETNDCRYVREDIVGGTSLRLISTPVGIIGVAICKDVLWSERSIIQGYPDLADHLLIVSMNAAPARFWPEAVKIGDLGTGVFFVNTPQLVPEASRSKTEIAFWHVPGITSCSPKSRCCYYLENPKGTPFPGQHAALPPVGAVIFELNLKADRFWKLITEC